MINQKLEINNFVNHQHDEQLESVYANMLVEGKHKKHYYEVMTSSGLKKYECEHASKGCCCAGCDECMSNQPVEESKKKLSPAQKKIAQAAPPPDEITGADFKALAKKKNKQKLNELSDFKSYFSGALVNETGYSGHAELAKKVWRLTRVVQDEQAPYVVTMKDGKEVPLKGSTIIGLLRNKESDWVHGVESIRPAFSNNSDKESAYDTVDEE